jgi:peptidoglycan hydrolase-like protein with peptidoglycan-binding domain
MGRRLLIGAVAATAALLVASPTSALTNTQIPGLQVALRAHGLYTGAIDGIAGPRTAAAVRRFQRQAGLSPDGIAGIRTRIALGELGRPLFGRRVLVRGKVGWDVSVLQFLLAKRGFYALPIDGRFGARTERALRRFQRRWGLLVDGVAGPGTIAALDSSGARPPLRPTSRPSARHVVRAGDTLSAIATRYGTSVERLARANRLDPARVLLAGTRLRVPRFRPQSAARAATTASREAVRASLDRWSSHYGVEGQLVRALAWMESGYQQHLVSSAGALGVMQVTPATWDFVETVLLGRSVPRTVDGNVRVGVAFLRHLLGLFGGDERLALAAYYQGAKAVRQYGILPQTRAYVANVLALKSRV